MPTFKSAALSGQERSINKSHLQNKRKSNDSSLIILMTFLRASQYPHAQKAEKTGGI